MTNIIGEYAQGMFQFICFLFVDLLWRSSVPAGRRLRHGIANYRTIAARGL
ncbi:uncharacterized protein METZ01_LOCUS347591, partial [marine metagenome]